MGDDKSIRNLLISKQSDIIKYMEHLKFSDSDIRKVNNAIERLKTIEDEYRKSKTA